MGRSLAELQLLLQRCQGLGRCQPEGQVGQLTAVAWQWLAAAGDADVRAEAVAAVSGPSMTLARSALRALHALDCEERQQASALFYERWQDKPVILDSWFGLEASMPRADALDQVRALLLHPQFDPLAPNALRAVLGGFASNVPVFHAADGSTWRNRSLHDQRNPVTASRMAKVFTMEQLRAGASCCHAGCDRASGDHGLSTTAAGHASGLMALGGRVKAGRSQQRQPEPSHRSAPGMVLLARPVDRRTGWPDGRVPAADRSAGKPVAPPGAVGAKGATSAVRQTAGDKEVGVA